MRKALNGAVAAAGVPRDLLPSSPQVSQEGVWTAQLRDSQAVLQKQEARLTRTPSEILTKTLGFPLTEGHVNLVHLEGRAASAALRHTRVWLAI